jgi:hypothetical protein
MTCWARSRPHCSVGCSRTRARFRVVVAGRKKNAVSVLFV